MSIPLYDRTEGSASLILPHLSEPSRQHQRLVLTIVQLIKRLRPRYGSVIMVSKGICIKYGTLVKMSEAYAMQFVSQNTSIPVPKILSAFEHRGSTYITMERVAGKMIGSGWVNRSPESRTALLSQLQCYIQELRKLPVPPGMGVANVVGEALYDGRLPGPSSWFGPFRNIADFHRHLRQGIEPDANLDPDVNQLITLHGGQWPLVFTHGDLSSLNILVQGDKVVGIIDWETAGWFPSYWEYTTASQVNPQNSFWRQEIDHFLDPYPAELRMEEIRQRFFGDF